jgi:hypothetical protein
VCTRSGSGNRTHTYRSRPKHERFSTAPIATRHPAHAPSRGASRISGCLPRSAKRPALYGLVKAGIALTSGGPSRGVEQSGTSCFKVPRNAAQRTLDAGRASFHDLRVHRACLQTNPLTPGPCRMAPALPGIPHWEFFLVSFHFSLVIVYHTRMSAACKVSRGAGLNIITPSARFMAIILL